MSVIIRLQNLPWSANSLDIRQFFRGLSIPEGGVHIVGGEMGDAFIAFSTDEDARQAMMLGGGKIKEVQISLMLSSRNEMQKIIEAARQASMSNSLAQLLAPAGATLSGIPQQTIVNKDAKLEKRDSSDLSTGSHEMGVKRDKRDKSRSRSRERMKKDRRERDRDRDRRRRSRSRSRSRDRRRRRSNSRSRGRDSHTREREWRDPKDEMKKDNDVTIINPAGENLPVIPNLELLNTSAWQTMPTPLAQNAQLLSNIELFRNLAAQKGPLIPGGPGSLLSAPLQMDGKSAGDRFQNIFSNDGNGDFGNRGNSLGNQRGFGGFDERSNQDSRFDRSRGGNMFPNSGAGFPVRNGNENSNNSRFGGFGRSDNGFHSRGGSSSSRERSGFSRGLLDYPNSGPQSRQERNPNRQDNFSSKDDKVDEFGRSIQLRNRKNAASSGDENYRDDKFQDFGGFGGKFSGSQQNQRPSSLRGRDSWPPGGRGDSFPDRRGHRGSFEDRFRSNKSKYDDEGGCCVEIRNLLPHIAYGEVRRPFSSLKLIIKEIKFFDYGPKDKKCRIRFLNYENKRRAIAASSKIQINHKPVHLIEIDDSDFDDCIDEGVKRTEVKFSDDEEDVTLSPKDAYIQITGLPMNTEESDVANLFPNVVLDRILLDVDDDGKTKCAYLKFQKPLDAKVALGTPNRTVKESLVFLSSLPQYAFNDHLNKALRGKPGEDSELPDIMEVSVIEPSSNKSPNTCIHMKNVPSEANDRDICDFFSDIGLVPSKIHIILDSSGQPTGNAFCEFSTADEIESACGKNSAHLGKSIVTVSKVPRSEMLDALEATESGRTSRTSDSGKTQQNADGFGKPQCVVALENIPFRAGIADVINFFGWSYKLTEDDVMRRYNDRGQPTGDGRVCFRTPEDAARAVRFLNNRNLMGRPIRMKIL